MSVVNLSRRGFLRGSSALVLGFALQGFAVEQDAILELGPASGAGASLNAWLRLDADGVATIRLGASEMGQGVATALPMLLAEELDLPFERVRVEDAPVLPDYRRRSVSLPGRVHLTGGSESVRGYWQILREAGASARAMLVAAAAKRWGVRPGDCTTEVGVVRCGDRTLTYGELAADAARQRAGKAPVKDPAQFRLIGTSPPRVDLPPKVDGSAIFGIDVPASLYAAVRVCPHYGGTLRAVDDSAARGSPGVVDVIPVDRGMAVVADSWHRARKAADLLRIEWDPGAGAGLDDAAIDAALRDALERAKPKWRHGGGPKDGAWDLEATYAVPYLDHAPLEPLNATVHVQPDRVDVWVGTQGQAQARRAAAKALKRPVGDVYLHTPLLGGGFGRRGFPEVVEQAATIAGHFDVPVKLIWTREEQLAHGRYRPASLCRMKARLGDDGLPTDWLVQMASQNIIDDMFGPELDGIIHLPVVLETIWGGMTEGPYAIPRQRLDLAELKLPIRVGWWRSVHGSSNGFYRECFLDECAAAAGADPVAYRRALLADDRQRAVFEAALAQAGDKPDGMARGVALFESFGSIVAEVADITVTDGWPRVHRLAAAIDCGVVVHPDTVRAQVMGAATMGLSAALYEQLSFRDGAVTQSNFHQYRLAGMKDAPRVQVAIVPSAEAPGGVGEPGLPPAAAALGNAIFAATGKRLRRLPVGDQLRG